MPRRSARPRPDRTLELATHTAACPACGGPLWAAAKTRRTVVTLDGLVRLRLQVRRCRNPDCPRRGVCLRPEQEGRFALPQHEFGLDVIALVGRLRHAEHRSVPEIHAELARRGVADLRRGASATSWTATTSCWRCRARTPAGCGGSRPQAGRVILAIDGLQPDVGHEVLWVLRDVLSRRGPAGPEPAVLDPGRPGQAARRGQGGVAGADRRGGLRRPGLDPQGGQAKALDGVPHQLCHFHYLREAARPVYEADRHAKVQLKKKVRGIRPIERKVEGRDDAEAEAIRGYCAAVRSALTDDGRPPLEASGLKLAGPAGGGRREPGPGGRKKGLPKELTRLRAILAKGLEATAGAVAGRAGGLRLGASRRRRSSATRRGWTPRGCGGATAG